MKPIRMFGLVVLATLAATVAAGGSSAMAESTALCSVDPVGGTKCPAGYLISHVHEGSWGKATLLSSTLNVECNVLFLGDVNSANNLGAPLNIEGAFTYSNCNSNCTITEENSPAETSVLKEGHEYARVTIEFLIHVSCSGFLNCRYTGFFLSGGARGPLLSILLYGETQFQLQELHKESGALCPSSTELDIWLTPLSQTDITN